MLLAFGVSFAVLVYQRDLGASLLLFVVFAAMLFAATGLFLAKLDGTAKGGIVFAIEHALAVPVRYVGVGEKVGDLLPFDPEAFVAALFA